MPPNAVASINLTANPSALSTGLNAAYKSVANFAKLSAQALQGLNLAPKPPKNGGGLSVARVALATAVGTYTRRGIDLLVDQGKKIFEFNDKLVRFGISAKKTGAALEFVGRSARRVAEETGIDAGQVLDTGRAYVDLAGAANFSAEKMQILAKAGQVSEASGSDIAGMMYQLTTSMKVADGEMEDTMGGLINQAKEGAIEAKQMAKEFGAALPLFAKFGVIGREGAIQAGAMFQVIRDGYNTADEAGTGIVRIFAGLRANASRFEKAGVKIWNVDPNGYKHARKFSDIFRDINNSQLAKDPELLKKAFGRSEAWRGWEMLSGGVERLHQMEEAGRANGVIAQDLATYTESAAGRMAVAFEKMKNAAAEAFTPERISAFVGAIEDLGSHMEGVVGSVGKLVDAMNWFYGQGKKMRKDLDSGPTGLSQEMLVAANRYALKNGINPNDVVRGLQMGSYTKASIGMTKDELATEEFKKNIDKLMPDDRTTKDSNKLAVKTWKEATSGSDLKNAAQSYLNEAGLTSDVIERLGKEITDDKNKDARHEQVRTKEELDKQELERQKGMDAWTHLGEKPRELTKKDLKEDDRKDATVRAAQLLRDAFSGVKIEIHMDGNKVGASVQNATNPRRK